MFVSNIHGFAVVYSYFLTLIFDGMRIVTWNVNGIRSLIKESKSIDSVFEQLNADIVCFQVEVVGKLLIL